MRTVVLGPRPPELDAWIARRHALGQDTFDEVWDGEYHMAPAAHSWHGFLENEVAAVLQPLARRAGLSQSGAFNLGEPGNFRVPDRGLHRARIGAAWLPTAAMVIEIVSPDDETYDKLPFYASRGVDEVLIADPRASTLTLLVLVDGTYEQRDHSPLLDVSVAELSADIDWPADD